MNTPSQLFNFFHPQKPALLQPKTQPDTQEQVHNILDTPKETTDFMYINDTIMDYIDITRKLDQLSILFPDLIKREWWHIIDHAQDVQNAVFSGGAEPDETAMLTWYQENGEEDLKIVSDAVQILLSTVIDTYPEHPVVGLAYMQYEALFGLPVVSHNHITTIPKTKYHAIFPPEADDSEDI